MLKQLELKQATTLKQKHITTLHGAWWVTKFTRLFNLIF